MSKDFEELESEFLEDQDTYAKEIQQKMDRRLLVSNFLEGKSQARTSKFGGKMMADELKQEENEFSRKMLWNTGYFTIPIFSTAMLGTVTYPLAVRIARSKRLFKLRSFYAIHLAIAPFLALIHINFFSLVQTLFRIKLLEMEYRKFRPTLNQDMLDIMNCKT